MGKKDKGKSGGSSSSSSSGGEKKRAKGKKEKKGGGDLFDSEAARAEAKRIQRMAEALSEESPPWAAKYIVKAAPAIGVIGAGVEVIGPSLVRFGFGAYALYQSLPATASKGLWGLSLCFFGGRYNVSIAAIEAFRSTGGSRAYVHLVDLLEQQRAIRAANSADDEEVGEDGVAVVQKLDRKQLARRKMAVVLRTTNPELVSRACSGIWTAYVGVLAVLKFKFAETVALAESIAGNIRPVMTKVAGPSLLAVTPPEYHQWVSPALGFSCKLIAGTLAWRIQFYLSVVQSGISGGVMASRALMQILRERQCITMSDDETMADEVLGWSLAGCGIYMQVFKGGPVPYLLSPMFWPLDIFERVLKWNVTWASAKDMAVKEST